MKDLRKLAIQGVVWKSAQQFGGQFINFIVSILLARILLPEEFGLIGMIIVFIAIADFLIDSGLSASLIRTTQPSEKDYSTVFYVNLIISVLIYLFFYLLAPFVSAFYNEALLTELLRVLAIGIIISGFALVQKARLTKEMNFKDQFKIQLPSLIVSGVVGMVLALNEFGVWSLVYMKLCRNLLSTIQYWLYSKWVPKRIFSTQKLKLHLNFGYKLTISGLIDTIYSNMYYIIIGKYFSTAELGFYSRANSTKQLPVNNIANVVNTVTYPLFSDIKDDKERLGRVYMVVMEQVLFWMSPILIGAVIVAEPMFTILFTSKWLPAVPMFQILCFVGIMYPLNAYNLNVLNVKGRSDLFLKLELIKKSYTVIGVIILAPYGILPLLYFQVAASVISFFINSFYSGKFINYPISKQLKQVFPIFFLSATMGMVCFAVNELFVNQANWFKLIIVTFCGLSYYIGMSYLFRLKAFNTFMSLYKKRK